MGAEQRSSSANLVVGPVRQCDHAIAGCLPCVVPALRIAGLEARNGPKRFSSIPSDIRHIVQRSKGLKIVGLICEETWTATILRFWPKDPGDRRSGNNS
jgi:hypothetical protein